MKNKAGKNAKMKKGILMSLLVIVLFVLMLGEIMAYVVININYSMIEQTASLASIQGTQAALVRMSLASFLHSSLSAAVLTLNTYEGTPSLRKNMFINNTQYALRSLMMNGTLYGVNLTDYMGNLTIAKFRSTVGVQLARQGLNVTLNPGANLTLSQTTPAVINATYSVFVTINTTGSSYNVPIIASVGMQLNGTPDLSSLLRAAPATISVSNISKVIMIGGVNAKAGSTGPFMFAFGTEVYKSRPPDCGSIDSNIENKNHILVTIDGANIAQDACGMGGIITATPNSLGYNTPYLVYGSSSDLQSTMDGTQILLDGPGLATYSVASLQSAIQNDNYFTSPYLPGYLNGPVLPPQTGGNGGLFSFGMLNRVVPQFDSNGVTGQITIASASSVSALLNFSVSAWVYGYPTSSRHEVIDYDQSSSTGSVFLNIQSNKLCFYVKKINSAYLCSTHTLPEQWNFLTATFSNGNETIYVNGMPSGNFVASGTLPTIVSAVIGFCTSCGGAGYQGAIANVKAYNFVLSPAQVEALYLGGISAQPTNTISGNLLEWYPLNGNANDYSGHGNSGVASNVIYVPLSGYYRDPVYQNMLSGSNVSEVEGILNCGNINQCTNSQQHLYLGGWPLEISGGAMVNESAAFNLSNALIPGVLNFNGGYVVQSSGIGWMRSASQNLGMSIWVYPTGQSGVIVDELGQSQANTGWHYSWLEMVSGTLYARVAGLSCMSLGTLPIDQWSNIAITYDGSTLTGYVNGTKKNSETGTRTVPGSGSMYYALGANDGTNCGSGAAFSGLMSDFQVYNSLLSTSQVLDLYLNDSVNAGTTLTPSLAMRLSQPYDGNANTTAERISNNFGVFYNASSDTVCNVSSAVNGYCGLSFTPP